MLHKPRSTKFRNSYNYSALIWVQYLYCEITKRLGSAITKNASSPSFLNRAYDLSLLYLVERQLGTTCTSTQNFEILHPLISRS